MKKKLSIIFVLVLALILSACGGAKEVKPTSVVIRGEEFLQVGASSQLEASVLPQGSDQSVAWFVEKSDIVSVNDEGLVTAHKTGKAKVKATSTVDRSIYFEFDIEVISLKIKGVKNIKVGDDALFEAVFSNAAFASKVTWSTIDASVATIDETGKLSAHKLGETSVKVTSLGEFSFSASFNISVTRVDNEDFNDLMDQLFLDLLGTDPMNINFTLMYPEVYGLENCKVEAYEFSVEAESEYFDELRVMIASIEAFSDNELSENQILDKVVLLDYLNHKLAYEGFYYYGSDLGSYLGYQAQLPIILAEYRFDDEVDIENYFDYLIVTEETFREIVKFEKEKGALGMGLTDVILDRVIEQCDAFIESEEENYLIPVFNSKIDSLDFLTSAQKSELKARNESLVNHNFVEAYSYLKDELLSMKGQNKGPGALASFELGKEYYEVLFQDKVGTNMTIPEVKAYLTKILNNQFNAFRANQDNYYRDQDNIDLMGKMGLSDLIPFFLKNMEGDFPSLGFTPKYEIKEIHPSLQENSSPAMYFLSPLDGDDIESIYINPKNFSEPGNYMYQTIAHEGCPGHLYQHVYLKNTDLPLVRKDISFTGYAEGWTTYIENYILKYNEYGARPSVAKSFEFFDSITYVIIGLADIGINYEGWSIAQTGNFIGQYLSIDEEQLIDIYYDMTEIPTNYLQYYFSYYQMQDMKQDFKAKMGSDYSDYLFHKIFLETGPTSFNILKDQYNKYVSDYASN